MKKLTKIISVLGLALFLGLSAMDKASAQCKSEEFLSSNIALLGPKYSYLKSKIIESERPRKKFNFLVPLTKKTMYVITAAASEETQSKLVISIFDKKDNFVISNYNKSTGKFYERIVFPCNASGKYRLEYFFEGDEGGCGVSVLGYKQL